MSIALSVDLRRRVVAAVVEGGLSHREAAERFKVSAASVGRWRALVRTCGDVRPGPLGGDRKTHAVEAHETTILDVFEARRDMAIQELRAELAKLGLSFGYDTLWRFFKRRRYTRKKSRRTPRSRTGPTS